MKRTLVVVAAVVGFAAAASAGTLNVFTTNSSNAIQNTFFVGETILLKVTGDGQGQTAEDSLAGTLVYSGAITDTLGATQGVWLPAVGVAFFGDGNALVFNQTGSPPSNTGTATSVATLIATAVGISQVTWGGTLLDFFGIYSYDSAGLSIPTGHSFTVIPVPEPSTAALIGLGLFGLVFGGRRRA